MAKLTVVIAGGAGFLGSHLCDRYIETGHKVIAIDNLSTGSRANIEHLEKNQNFNFIEHDITQDLPLAVSRSSAEIIINMASPASPPTYQRLAVETLMAGSIGVKNLLDLAEAKKSRFFQASTSEVYGDPEVHPQPESYRGSVNSYGPRSMYDEAKRFAEAMVYVYRRSHGVNTVVARIFNTYGPRMDPDDGRVVSNFIVQALEGRPLTVYGKGNQTRSFCYVDDLVNGIEALIESYEEGPINLGNVAEFTIHQLAELVLEFTASTSTIDYQPLGLDDPLLRKPVIDLAIDKLGWQPKISLRQGLIPTISYFSEKIGKSG